MIGIDVSKNTLACSLVEASSQERLWFITVPNTSEGIKTLLSKTPPAHALGAGADRKIQPLCRTSSVSGRTKGTDGSAASEQAFLNSLQSRAKTDKIDSLGLALFGLSRPLPAYPIKEAALETIDQLLSARKLLSSSISRLQLQQKELTDAAPFLQGRYRRLEAADARLRPGDCSSVGPTSCHASRQNHAASTGNRSGDRHGRDRPALCQVVFASPTSSWPTSDWM
jgi:hypothetical protein